MPSLHLPEVKSIIVLGIPYVPSEDNFSILAEPGEPYIGLISSIALSPDYHRTAMKLLNELIKRISPLNYKILVDSGGLVEREWAVKAGLGFWGKNCCVISPSKGSFFNIGLLLTNLNLQATQYLQTAPASNYQDCGACTKCIDACPGKALTPFRLNYKNCVSYITQKSGTLSAEEQDKMGRWVYGCDVCQRVCPYNDAVSIFAHGSCKDVDQKAAAYSIYQEVSLPKLINMTEEEFNRIYGQRVMAWKGIQILKRNAHIVYKTVYSWR